MFHRLKPKLPSLVHLISVRYFFSHCTEAEGLGNISGSPVKDTFTLWLTFRCPRKCPTQIRGFYSKYRKKCLWYIRSSDSVRGFPRQSIWAQAAERISGLLIHFWFFQPPWRTSLALGKVYFPWDTVGWGSELVALLPRDTTSLQASLLSLTFLSLHKQRCWCPSSHPCGPAVLGHILPCCARPHPGLGMAHRAPSSIYLPCCAKLGCSVIFTSLRWVQNVLLTAAAAKLRLGSFVRSQAHSEQLHFPK